MEKNTMMSHKLRLLFVIPGLVLFAALSVIGTLSARQANAQDTCTLNTIKGTYIWEGQGVFIDGENAPPYAEAGIWTLDGEGHAQGIFSASLGTEFIDKESFTATYTHVSDCVFVVIAPVGNNETVEFHFFSTLSGDIMTYFGPGFSGTHIRQ
jgi:hypothetical protein